MKQRLDQKIQCWLAESLTSDICRALNRLARADDVQRIAVMPDVHLAGETCNGTVIATRELVYPAAVGNDIGCGIATVRLQADADFLRDTDRADRVLAACARLVPANRHSASTAPESLPADLLCDELRYARLEKLKSRDARVQFGTLGRGNHFVEFQVDGESQLWLMVHSGSRGIGQAISNHHLARCSTHRQALSHFVVIDPQDNDYLHDARWAMCYAELNRRAIIAAIANYLAEEFGVPTEWETLIQSCHNGIWRESHGEHEYWVHRKGAQSAQLDEPGMIPGSMGTASFHVVGRGNPAALCSSSHGAGRRMSRHQAKRSITRDELHYQLDGVSFDRRRANLLRDEAPRAYKDIYAVMRAQRKLVRTVRELHPLVCYKGT